MFSNILKSHFKTAVCVFLTLCLSLVTLSGCNNKNESVVQSENYKMDSSEYLYVLTQQIFAAQSALVTSMQTMPQVSDIGQLISEGTIEDQPAADWIKDSSTKIAKTILAARMEFDKLGLSLSEEDQNKIKESIDKSYESMEKYYNISKLGITKEALQQYLEDQQKAKQVSDEYFGEGKSKYIPNDKIDEYTKNHGLKYKVITIDKPVSDKDDSAAKLLKNEGVSNVKELADKYMKQIAAKKSIDDINAAYNKAAEISESPLDYTFQYDELNFAEKQFVLDLKPNSPATLKEDDEAYYIIQRFDIDQEYIDKQRELSKSILLSKASEELVNELFEKYDIKINQGAIDKHDPVAQAKLISENLQKSKQQQSQDQQEDQKQQSQEQQENQDKQNQSNE